MVGHHTGTDQNPIHLTFSLNIFRFKFALLDIMFSITDKWKRKGFFIGIRTKDSIEVLGNYISKTERTRDRFIISIISTY